MSEQLLFFACTEQEQLKKDSAISATRPGKHPPLTKNKFMDSNNKRMYT